MCLVDIESIDHVLFRCNRVKEVWDLTFHRVVFLQENFNHSSMVDRWMKINSIVSKADLELVAITC